MRLDGKAVIVTRRTGHRPRHRPARRGRRRARAPRGRARGEGSRLVTIDDIVPLVCFLLADQSRRITGAEIAVDAGWAAGKHCPGLPGF